MRDRLRAVAERVLRQVPLARAAYYQRDLLQARVDALEAQAARRVPPLPEPLLDPHRLEEQMPACRGIEERIVIATRCRDADVLPKVADAGRTVREPDGTQVQVMFNGVRVLAGGYNGAWMQDLIERCHGHHEPQEELVFAEVLRHLPRDAAMIELGGFWSYYSIWFLREGAARRSVVVEPVPENLALGRVNARLNEVSPVFVNAFAGAHAAPPTRFQSENSPVLELPCASVQSLMAEHRIAHLDLLHCDAQGIELAIVESCVPLGADGRLEWLIVSTHAHQISGDALTHQRCLATLRRAGAAILAEHDVQESFSGDGLIVAKFGAVPADWTAPRLSYNRASESLFRNPLYDLAQARTELAAPKAALPAGGLAVLAESRALASSGAIASITADGPLGRAGDSIVLPFDQVMFPHVAAHGGWALETLAFIETRIDSGMAYTLLDIGANVGLFTREAALRLPNIRKMLCVEADPGNFRALRYNLAGWPLDTCSQWNVALSDADGEVRFFRDRENFGNYSLNDDAMRGRPHDTITVRAAETETWMRAHVPPADRLIWKSDTQGFDELIISRVPEDIWARVAIAVVGLWRIRKPAYDRAAFLRQIDSFPNKSIGPDGRCASADILAYLDADDWQHADLYLWR